MAIGLIETKGTVCLVAAGDAVCKAANVELINTVEIGGGYVSAVIKGEIGSVKAAIDAGSKTLKALGAEIVAVHVIPQPHESTLSAISKK